MLLLIVFVLLLVQAGTLVVLLYMYIYIQIECKNIDWSCLRFLKNAIMIRDINFVNR